ncbi:hypothetical protein SLA2020_278070 [Shorea laevis]
MGVVSFPFQGDKSLENCSICCEDKLSLMMVTMKCSHKFCSNCMKTYVDGKVQSCQVPVRCPELRCKYYISTTECRSFLPLVSYESLERALAEANVVHSDRIYCPYPIVLSCLILVNVCQLEQVHQVNLIIAVLSAQFARSLSVWTVVFLGILQ